MINKIKSGSPNESQYKAISLTEGPLLIIAGPGSGKTFTLVERVVHILKTKEVESKNFLIATFTEKAAKELKTRISNRILQEKLNFNINEMFIGTFHSVCLDILEQNREFTRLKKNFKLLDQFDQQYLIYKKLKEFESIEGISNIIGNHQTSRWDRSEKILKWVNKISEEAIELTVLKNSENDRVIPLALVCEKYREILENDNSLDFSTIQYELLLLLNKYPQIKDKLQEQIKYLMVDEYQDTNTIQELILKKLMNSSKNICVVGDDDQGLYRFRGATIRNILEFKDQFAANECSEICLEVNYRSHPGIVKFYNEWMEHQFNWNVGGITYRKEKEIRPDDKPFPQYPSVLRVSGPQESFWHEEVRAFLEALRDSKKLTNWNQVAFLFKSVKSDKAVGLARYLEESGIPVYSPRSNMYFEREEVRLMFGCFLFLFPIFGEIRKSMTGFQLEIWNYYDDCLRFFAQEIKKSENQVALRELQIIARDHQLLASKKDYSFLGLFYQLLKFPLFSRFMEETDAGVVNERSMRNLSLFSQMLAKFEYLHNITVIDPKFIRYNVGDLFNNYFRFIQDGGLNEFEDDSEYAPSGCVSFLTIHQSKGLEFPIVLVDSLNDVPKKQYTELDEIIDTHFSLKTPYEPIEFTKNFDFKRLYYTAFSRAQNLLVLTCPEKREGHGKTPSAYFKDMFDVLPDWKDVKFLNEIEISKVKEINLKNEYSFTSHINVFEQCSQQYRFFKEFGFTPVRAGPIIFGTLVHQTIEDIHKLALRGEEHLITEEMIVDWFNLNYEVLSKSQRVYLNQSVLDVAFGHVTRYFLRESRYFDKLKDAEVEVSLVKDNYILMGQIDLIKGLGETVEIIDFKSEKKPDINGSTERLRQYQHQLEIYSHIVEQKRGVKVSKMHLYYTSEENGNPFVTFDREDSNIEETISQIDGIVARIEAKDFTIKERPTDSCKDCDMRSHCDMKYKKAA